MDPGAHNHHHCTDHRGGMACLLTGARHTTLASAPPAYPPPYWGASRREKSWIASRATGLPGGTPSPSWPHPGPCLCDLTFPTTKTAVRNTEARQGRRADTRPRCHKGYLRWAMPRLRRTMPGRRLSLWAYPFPLAGVTLDALVPGIARSPPPHPRTADVQLCGTTTATHPHPHPIPPHHIPICVSCSNCCCSRLAAASSPWASAASASYWRCSSCANASSSLVVFGAMPCLAASASYSRCRASARAWLWPAEVGS